MSSKGKTGLKVKQVPKSSIYSGIKKPDYNGTRLVVRFFNGKNLLASDVETGKSDPVGFVWLGLPGMPLPDWDNHEEEGSNILLTSVCQTTCDPIWEEDVTYPLNLADFDSLMDINIVILIRDEDIDPQTGAISYDDLGIVEIPIRDVITGGKPIKNSIVSSAKKYTLQKAPGMRKVDGYVRLATSIYFKEEEVAEFFGMFGTDVSSVEKFTSRVHDVVKKKGVSNSAEFTELIKKGQTMDNELRKSLPNPLRRSRSKSPGSRFSSSGSVSSRSSVAAPFTVGRPATASPLKPVRESAMEGDDVSEISVERIDESRDDLDDEIEVLNAGEMQQRLSRSGKGKSKWARSSRDDDTIGADTVGNTTVQLMSDLNKGLKNMTAPLPDESIISISEGQGETIHEDGEADPEDADPMPPMFAPPAGDEAAPPDDLMLADEQPMSEADKMVQEHVKSLKEAMETSAEIDDRDLGFGSPETDKLKSSFPDGDEGFIEEKGSPDNDNVNSAGFGNTSDDVENLDAAELEQVANSRDVEVDGEKYGNSLNALDITDDQSQQFQPRQDDMPTGDITAYKRGKGSKRSAKDSISRSSKDSVNSNILEETTSGEIEPRQQLPKAAAAPAKMGSPSVGTAANRYKNSRRSSQRSAGSADDSAVLQSYDMPGPLFGSRKGQRGGSNEKSSGASGGGAVAVKALRELEWQRQNLGKVLENLAKITTRGLSKLSKRMDNIEDMVKEGDYGRRNGRRRLPASEDDIEGDPQVRTVATTIGNSLGDSLVKGLLRLGNAGVGDKDLSNKETSAESDVDADGDNENNRKGEPPLSPKAAALARLAAPTAASKAKVPKKVKYSNDPEVNLLKRENARLKAQAAKEKREKHHEELKLFKRQMMAKKRGTSPYVGGGSSAQDENMVMMGGMAIIPPGGGDEGGNPFFEDDGMPHNEADKFEIVTKSPGGVLNHTKLAQPMRSDTPLGQSLEMNPENEPMLRASQSHSSLHGRRSRSRNMGLAVSSSAASLRDSHTQLYGGANGGIGAGPKAILPKVPPEKEGLWGEIEFYIQQGNYAAALNYVMETGSLQDFDRLLQIVGPKLDMYNVTMRNRIFEHIAILMRSDDPAHIERSLIWTLALVRPSKQVEGIGVPNTYARPNPEDQPYVSLLPAHVRSGLVDSLTRAAKRGGKSGLLAGLLIPKLAG